MKKLLVLAAVSAMAMGAKADYTYTLDLPGAGAAYALQFAPWEDAETEFSEAWENSFSPYLHNAGYKTQLHCETWAQYYGIIEPLMFAEAKFDKNGESFSIVNPEGEYGRAWLVMALTDATELTPGAAYSVYYGTADAEGGPITIQKVLASGSLESDAAPVPEPTSGLLLLLGVAGLALKRKRA